MVLRKKQTIRAVLHTPSSPQVIAHISTVMCEFYLAQLEIQIQKYDISQEQKTAVILALADEYRLKAQNEG